MLTNAWPDRVQREKTVIVDQFSAATINTQGPEDWGLLPKATEWAIVTHMGTQYGLVTRILMTTGCLVVLWSVFTATVMWWKRRPSGKVGLPRRTTTQLAPRSRRGLIGIGVPLALIYPLWGVSLLLVFSFDRLVVQRVGSLRRLSGLT